MLCAGDVKLSISSSAGKTLILRIAKPVDFKARNLVALQGSTMMISNRAALETLGGD